MSSLRRQLVAIVLAFGLCFVALAYFIVLRHQAIERETSGVQFTSHARAVALAVGREIGVMQTGLAVLSQAESLAQGDLPRFHALASRAAAEVGPGVAVSLVSAKERIFTTRGPLGARVPMHPGPAADVMITGIPFVSDMFTPPLAGSEPIIVVTRRVLSRGVPHGLAMSVPVSRFTALLMAQGLPAGWLSALVDGDGKVFARSFDVDKYIGRRATDGFLLASEGREEGTFETVALGGEAVHGAFARVNGTRWRVAVSRVQPTTFAARVASASLDVWGVTLVLFALGAVAAYALSRRVLDPLDELGRAARDMGSLIPPSFGAARRLAETRPVCDALSESYVTIKRADEAQRRLADELRDLAATQEARVKERTAQLEAQAVELREARKLAEDANRAKGDFLAQMSHEIRTPMTAVLALADLLLLDCDSPREAERLRLLRSSAMSLRGLLDDVLDFTKIEAGRITLDPVSFSPRALVTEVVGLFQPLASSKSDLLRLSTDRLPERVRGDAARVRQVLCNLVGNAVKFTSEGRIEIAAWATEDGRRLHFRVADSGIGISDAYRKRMFEVFEQGGADVARRFGGTGLGLAIAKALVEAMGGRIAVEDRKTPGAAFVFDVRVEPEAVAALVDAGAVASRRPAHVASTGARTGVRILLAEDNDVTREVERTMLEREGHEVIAVADGDEAAEAARTRGPFDLAILDLRMPRVDGIAAAKSIRANAATARLPLVALSADPLRFRHPDALSLFVAHLEKPIDWEELNGVIARLATGAAGATEPRDAANDEHEGRDEGEIREGCDARDPRGADDSRDVRPTPEPAWDVRVLRKLGAAKPREALRSLLEDFVAACRQQIDVLRVVQRSGDGSAFAAEAHTLAGVAATVGWIGVREAARSAERETSADARTRWIGVLQSLVDAVDLDSLVAPIASNA